MSGSFVQQEQRRIEELIAALEAVKDPQARECAKQLVRGVLELHGAGLARLLTILVDASASGQTTVETLAQDESVGALLLLHGLHPLELAERVRQAIEKMRASLGVQGIGIELLSVGEEVVRVKLSGNGQGKNSSATRLRREIEDAIFTLAPEVAAIEIENLPDANVHAMKFVPVSTLRANRRRVGP